MQRFNHWKLTALTLLVPLLVTWQPAIHACVPAGSHGGC